ncbi:hypothetical protein RhiirA5_429076 [Rhizophagus irregularis]|uniref:Uncharacterized protein n=1 Tax=Rhizophagus irregularis TaxID=588596 RepID=A0A2I1DZF1_9GLOM|nr:hypothetical protein RhiirA5_429076 [Rhizophagus irregularis]PKY15250.1 hypothetical protein RhiirB3_427414 [Rhizophagus irregularis]CAB5193596.1 unnamed protein product [Rhizophagus irregularis]
MNTNINIINIILIFTLHFIDDDNDDNNNIFNEVEDPRYNTQTYKFSLDDLNKAYNDLINNRLRLLDIS